MRDGGDPAAERRQKRHERQNAGDTDRPLSWWLENYIEYSLGTDTKHKRNEASHVRHALSEVGLLDQPSRVIAETHLKELIDHHYSRPATARHRLGALSRFLDFLHERKIIDTKPVNSIAKKNRPKPPAPRGTFYSEEQLKMLWHPERPLKEMYSRYLRFLITTPLRAGEAAELRIKQINASRMEISLSSDETKNRQPFVMPLTEIALQQMNLKDQSAENRVFQLSTKPNQTMRSWSHFNTAIRKATGIEGFNIHNLRRTFSTLIAENSEYGEGLIDGLLNHKQSATRTGVMRHYQLAKHTKRRREVMNWWQDFLINEVAID